MTETDPTIAAAIAALRARDPDVAADAESALDWLTRGEGPAVLSQNGLQYFLWYQLPVKWLTGSAHHRRVAAALAEVLDLLGLPRYAAICRSDTTVGVLDAYAHSPVRGQAAWRRADDASGISPPDLPDFKWGKLVGHCEAVALSSTTDFLELAAAAGDLAPGRGRKARTVELVRRHLTAPRPELAGRSLLDTVWDERLGDWLELHSRGRAWPPLLDHLAPLLLRPAELPPGIGNPLPLLGWLLDRLAGGQPLTQNGNLNRALVQDASALFGGREAALFGEPNREDEPRDLRLVHDLAVRLKALRRRGEILTLNPRGRALLDDPEAMWRAAAQALLPQPSFFEAAGEVTLALLLAAAGQREDALDTQVQQAIADQHWRDRRTGVPADDQVVIGARHATTNLLRALNLIEKHGRWPQATLGLTPVGRAIALEALHHRALGPRA
jgi:hypothetical protein